MNKLKNNSLMMPAFIFVLLIAVLASAFSVIYTTHLTRQAFAQLQLLTSNYRQLTIEKTQYVLEKSTLVAPAVLEKKARNRLLLQRPEAEQIVIVNYE